MVEFLDLPDVPLGIVFKHLPVWQLRILFLLYNRRLYKLIKSDFSTRRHLSLHCGIRYYKTNYIDYLPLIDDFSAEFDLVIRFEDPQMVVYNSDYILSPDLKVKYIAKMVKCFPRVTHLTLGLANECPTRIVVQLLQGWQEDMESLKIVNLFNSSLNWEKVALVVKTMTKLEHFKFYSLPYVFNIYRDDFDSFIWSGQLKTYINTDYPQYINEPKHAFDRAIWNKPEYAKVVEKFETFGVLKYAIASPNSDFTNLELLRKLKLMHVRHCADIAVLRRVDLTNWTAVQLLTLEIGKVCLGQLFTMLSVLTNLKELTIKVDKVRLPRGRTWANWTRLPSVRRLQLVSLLDAHKFFMVADCVPNATNCSLKHPNLESIFRDFPQQYFERRTLKLCEECVAVMKRASEKYTNNINSFVWLRQMGEDGTHSMAPMVQLFTEDVGDTKRLSTRYIPIH